MAQEAQPTTTKSNPAPLDAAVPMTPSAGAYFQNIGVDMTFVRNWPMVVQPESNMNADIVRFNIPKMSQGNYYMFQDMKLRMNLILRDKDDNVLQSNDLVAPVCNLGMSLWQDVRLFLNNTQVTAGTNGERVPSYFAIDRSQDLV